MNISFLFIFIVVAADPTVINSTSKSQRKWPNLLVEFFNLPNYNLVILVMSETLPQIGRTGNGISLTATSQKDPLSDGAVGCY